MSLNIIYIKHKDVNKEKWNKCIDISKNRIVYALTWYLDRISPNWDALIEGDYESVMPIIHRRKYFTNYIYNPFFTAKLGIFSKKNIDNYLVNRFFRAIPKKFKLIDIKLNSYQNFSVPNFKTQINTTYELYLNKSYEEIAETFSKNHKKNIVKGYNSNITIKKENDVSELILLKKNQMLNLKNSQFKNIHFFRLSNILNYALNKGYCIVYNAYDTNDNICASAVFLTKYNRAVKYTATNDIGKKNRAGYLLIDTFIKDMSGSNLILDFAGSNIKGIANFNAGFGSAKYTYQNISANNLGVPLKLLKR